MKITLSEHATIPERAHKYDAGLDICSTEDAEIPPYSFITVNTGVSVELPIGTVGLLTSKSGLMAKQGITTRGTIDCGYTGEIKVTLFNHSGKWRYIEKGQKVSQLVVLPVLLPTVEIVDKLDETERGCNGFGSTGK